MIRFKRGYKYQLDEIYVRALQEPIVILYDYSCMFFSIERENRILTLQRGYAWNGADCFPDFDWIMEGSAVHDCLLQLIALGIIPESENNKIDNELGHVVRDAKVLPKVGGEGLLKFRSAYVARATRLMKTRKGDLRPTIQIPRDL